MKGKILKEMEKLLLEEGFEPINEDDKGRKFYVKLYCPYYSEANDEYMDWDIEVDEFVINGKRYEPEAFDYFIYKFCNSSLSPSMFYDLTSKYQEITEENMFDYLDWELQEFKKNYLQR